MPAADKDSIVVTLRFEHEGAEVGTPGSIRRVAVMRETGGVWRAALFDLYGDAVTPQVVFDAGDGARVDEWVAARALVAVLAADDEVGARRFAAWLRTVTG